MSNQKIGNFIKFNNVIETYNINKYFDDYVFQKEYFPYQFDGWKDKVLYGLLNKNGDAVYPKNIALSLNSADNNFNYKNLLFVVDAFQDMKKYNKSFALTNRSGDNKSIYASFDIKNGAKEIDDLYIKYMNHLYGVFSNTFLSDSKKLNIKDINSFINVFISFIKTISKAGPITRSSFIKNKFCDPSVNGLIIDIEANTKSIDTKEKANKYISDDHFETFVDTARRYGFFVDRNMPWRIMADLESPVMRDYYRKYKWNSVDDVFKNCYHVAFYSDLDVIKNIIVSFWNTYANSNTTVINSKQLEGCENLFIEVSSLNQIDTSVFDLHFNINWLIRFYAFIKVLENNINITQTNFEILYQEAIKLNEYIDTKNSLEYINRKIKELTQKETSKILLTTPEETIRMLSLQEIPSIAEGINF